MSRLWTVTVHEFRRVAANRAFIILTLLGPFLIVSVTVVPALVSRRAERRDVRIAAVGLDPAVQQQVSPALAGAGIDLEAARTRDEAEARLAADELYGYLVVLAGAMGRPQGGAGGTLELVSREVPDIRVVEVLKGVLGQAFLETRLREAGLDAGEARALTAPLSIETVQVTRSGGRSQPDRFSFIMVGIAFTLMLYMTILLYGQSIGRSVVQEKTARTVEIVLSSVSERQLLFGKILGQAAAGLLQYAVWVGIALLGVGLLGPRLGRLPQVSLPILLYLVLFFLLGFLLYAALYAAVGAAAEDEQNLGQLAWPIILFLVFPMVSSGPIIMQPGSSFSVLLSLFPLTAPIVMFVRILVSQPPAWQVLLSIGIQALSVLAFTVISARIFRVGILMTGRHFRAAEILRWLRA
jgi:ABC-2 type transport system permease protein